MPARSVFISYSSKDYGIVREIRQALEAMGIETWNDPERIENADHFLAIVSPDTLKSRVLRDEMDRAKAVRRASYKIILIMGTGIEAETWQAVFGKKPVGIPLGIGSEGLRNSIPLVLAAMGKKVPTEVVQRVQAQIAPVADLVIELKDLAMPPEQSVQAWRESDNERRLTVKAESPVSAADAALL